MKTPTLILKSHGLKRLKLEGKNADQYSVIPRSDFLVDCRGIKEYGLHRNDPSVYQSEIAQHCPEAVQAMVTSITESLKHLKDRRFGEHDALTRPFVVVFLCAWGCNRSPNTKAVVGGRLKALGFDVEIE